MLVPTFVSTRANSVKNDDPSCLEPAEEADTLPLFDRRGSA
jgi:hypothetical protein